MRTLVADALAECVHVASVMHFLRLAEPAGWRMVFPGPAAPIDEVIAAATREQADLVRVSSESPRPRRWMSSRWVSTRMLRPNRSGRRAGAPGRRLLRALRRQPVRGLPAQARSQRAKDMGGCGICLIRTRHIPLLHYSAADRPRPWFPHQVRC